MSQHEAVIIRRLEPDETALLRVIRLRSLADAPTAFGSTYAREAAFTEADWQHRLRADGFPHYVAEDIDGIPSGIAVGATDAERSQVAYLLGMWVAPESRGSGAADALIEQVVRWAESERIRALKLHVTEGNARAERVYQRHGFVRTGETFVRERDGLLEIEMQRVAS